MSQMLKEQSSGLLSPAWMLICVDETGNDMRTLRQYGYGVRGIPPRDFSLRIRGKHYTAIGMFT